MEGSTRRWRLVAQRQLFHTRHHWHITYDDGDTITAMTLGEHEDDAPVVQAAKQLVEALNAG